jgi:hypothetical protein
MILQAKCIERHSADLYNNILKPMVKVGKDFVSDGKAVETDAADLYNNILKSMCMEKDFTLQVSINIFILYLCIQT